MKDIVLAIIVFLCWSSSLLAQEPYKPLRIHDEFILDGKLDEPQWQLAQLENDFMQYDPSAGSPPSEKTEVRIMYNDEYLFVGVKAFDDEPSKLVAKYLERDFPNGQDDGMAFIIDTYNDKSTGLAFITNLFDARWDAEFSGDGTTANTDYNTYWDAKSTVESWGYVTEFRIPFSSLRFETKDTVRMGFRCIRMIKRRDEFCIFPKCDPNLEDAYFKVSSAREMELYHLKSKRPFYVAPYAIANYSMENTLNSDETAYEKQSEFLTRKYYAEDEALDKFLSNVGFDVKYGLTKNATMDLTVNTDFAQTEVDDLIINLSKYEINLPEKRSFFLESQNYLNYGTTENNQLFISRSIGREDDLIVPIIAGVRVTGKSKGWQMGLLDMQTKGIDYSSVAPHNFFVFRTRKDIDSLGSFVGGIFTNRINTGTDRTSGQTIALDVVKKLNEQVTFVGALASTALDGNFSNLAQQTDYNAGLFRSAREGIFYSLSADVIGKDFDPLMGFVEESDLVNIGFGGGKAWKAAESSDIAYWNVGSNLRYKWKPGIDKEETRAINATLELIYKNSAEIVITPADYIRDVLFYDWDLSDDITVPTGTYSMYSGSAELLSSPKDLYQCGLSAFVGGFYGGKRVTLNPDITLTINKHLVATVEYEYNNIQFPDSFSATGNGLYQTNLARLKISWFFSSFLSVKLYTQFDDLSHQLSSNIRLRYNPREGTDLYVVFNHGLNSDRDRMTPELPRVGYRAVTVKFIKTFGF